MSEFGFMEHVETVDPCRELADSRRGLSPLLQELEQVIGLKAVLSLVEAFGGTRTYIPHSADETHDIVQKIGLEAASKLSGYCGGERLEIPLASKYKKLQRDHEIYRMKKSGTCVTEIAKQFGINRRKVFEVVQRVNDRITEEQYHNEMRRAKAS